MSKFLTLCALTATLAACSKKEEQGVVKTDGAETTETYVKAPVSVDTDWQTLRRQNLGVYKVAGTDKRVVVGQDPVTSTLTLTFYSPVFPEPQPAVPPRTQFPGAPVPAGHHSAPAPSGLAGCIPEEARQYFAVRQRRGGSTFVFVDKGTGETYVADHNARCGYVRRVLDP